MASKRDNFNGNTKDIMARRVGYRCSNPNCRKLTCGANDNPQEFSNIGVAAHICAAARGGKRYDANMTPTERKDIYNGIWLCQSCAKLIDSDDMRYTVELLHEWKRISEEATIFELGALSPTQTVEQDITLIKFYVRCFDRPAFRDDIHLEGRMEDFDKAIEDTIIALNTGILRTRDDDVIKEADGKSSVQNSEWREKLYNVVDILTAIRRRLKIAKKDKVYSYRSNGHEGVYYFEDRELAEWFNSSREEILKIMASICKEIGIPELPFIQRVHHRE